MNTRAGKTPICIYNGSEDNIISETFQRGKRYEEGYLHLFELILEQDSAMNVIDIGANIGLYTLSAAKMGRQVIAVEPLPRTYKRLHASIQKNNFSDLVTLFVKPLSDRYESVHFETPDPMNPGATRFVSDGENPHVNKSIQSMLFNDLLPYISFRKAFLKMDIEGSELKVLTKSDNIFKNIEIPVFLMEWVFYSTLEYQSELMTFETWIRSLSFIPFKVVSHNTFKTLGPISLDPVWHSGYLREVWWIKVYFIHRIQEQLPDLKFIP